ncbi:MAG: HNH endonuclease family protein [Corynebacterium sp.]|nr:HNH endonuclease family protein [Corynebacterium sp.]
MTGRKIFIITAELIAFMAIIALVVFYSTSSPITDAAHTEPESTSLPVDPTPAISAEVEKLDTLQVAGRAPNTGYSREEFGQRWSDDVSVAAGHNGCDTRNDILRRDLSDLTLKPNTFDCVVLAGTLTDPYSGKVLAFTRGPDTSSKVQIDHVVALADAWQKGAQLWDADTRRDFANDPRNLLAVDGSLNSQKGAGDAATWLPPRKEFRCEYARIIVDVKAEYGLWVTPAEKEALRHQLDTC